MSNRNPMNSSNLSEHSFQFLLLHDADNVLVLRQPVAAGETVQVAGSKVTVSADFGVGHKLARQPIRKGEPVLKYGAPIGRAMEDIATGEHVHLHNLASAYTKIEDMDA